MKRMDVAFIENTEKAVQDFCGSDYHENLVSDVKQYMKTETENMKNSKRRQRRS